MSAEKSSPYDRFIIKERDYFGTKPSGGLVVFLEQTGLKSGIVLDFGAGEGRNALYLCERGFDVVAADDSNLALARLQEKAKSRNLKLFIMTGNLVDVDLGEDRFDLIVSIASLSSIGVEHRDRVAEKIEKALKVGGYLYLVVFTVDDPGCRHSASGPMSECSDCVAHYFGYDELKGLFREVEVVMYTEYAKADHSHGMPHMHGKAKLIGRKVGLQLH